jgi:hypothetical protein
MLTFTMVRNALAGPTLSDTDKTTTGDEPFWTEMPGLGPPTVLVTVFPSKLLDGVVSHGLVVKNNPASMLSGVQAIAISL